jgi:Bifunctional DNA primase/polymerase, N-terminal
MSLTHERQARPFIDNHKRYTESGFLVVPLDGFKPHPVCQSTPGGPASVADWLGDLPDDANIGVQIPEGLVVITVDVAESGATALRGLCENNGVQLPKTLCSYTSRGGLQAWFYGTAAPQSKPLDGVYINSYPKPIPVPPSVGANGQNLTWANTEPVAELPEGLRDALGVQQVARNARPAFVDAFHATEVSWTDAAHRLKCLLGATAH